MSFVHIYIFLSYIRIFIPAYTCTHKSLLKETMIGERKKKKMLKFYWLGMLDFMQTKLC